MRSLHIHTPLRQKFLLVSLLGLSSMTAAAQTVAAPEPTPSEWTNTFKTTATFGVGIATHADPSPSLQPGGSLNGNDTAANYRSGDVLSRLTKLHSSANFKHESGLGIAVSGMAWYDDGLLHHGVPHGNNANNYVAGAPLSDKGFNSLARFKGLALLDAFFYGSRPLDQGDLSWRIGRLTLEREPGFSFRGGLRDLETRNVAALVRPGAQPDEGAVPIWAATVRWTPSPMVRVDGFLQFAPEESVAPGCGTFFASDDYTAPGCNRVFYNNQLTESQALPRGVFTARGKDLQARSRPDQFGLSASYVVPNWGTRFGAHYAHYHSRTGYTGVLKGQGLGPTGGNTYVIEYPEDKDRLSLTAATRVPSVDLALLNEVSVTTGQPIQLNTTDLLNAFLAGRGVLGSAAIKAPANSLFRGYDRFRVIQAQTGVVKNFGSLLGADKSFLGAEASVKHVNGLPDVNTRRYGRPEITPPCPAGQICTTNDGFVTSTAWAYRLKFGLEFHKPFASVINIRPSIAWMHDVKGWAYDYSFVEGRRIWNLTVEADLSNDVFASLSYLVNRGGSFNPGRGLDSAFLSVGVKF